MSVDRDPNENDRGPSGAEVLASLITDALEKAKLVSWSQSFFIKLPIIVEKIPSGKLWKVSQILIINLINSATWYLVNLRGKLKIMICWFRNLLTLESR